MRLWVADGERGLMRTEGGICRRVGPGGGALCAGWGRVYCAGEKRCVCYDRETGDALFDTAIPGGVCALALLGDWVCALSSDADSVTAFSALNGDVLFSAPAGMYPRGLCVSRQGRYLAVAGGAAGCVLLLDGGLNRLREYRLPGTVCGVCFLHRGLAALCAVERGEITARLMRVSFRGVTEEMASIPLVPSCLCGLPGGGCAAGCMGETRFFLPNKKTALRQCCPCPLCIQSSKWGPLICDGCLGTVSLPDGRVLYRGKTPQGAVATA